VPSPPAAATAWPSLVLAGVVGSVAMLVSPLVQGLLAYGALGAEAATIGLAAAFLGPMAGAVVFALRSRAALPVAGPSAATALVVAATVARLAADPALRAKPGSIVALVGVAVALAGLAQVLAARWGLAQLVRQVPRPVLGGFMDGIALLIVVAQWPLLLGLRPGSAAGLPSPDQLPPLLLGLAAAAGAWLASRRWPRVPKGWYLLAALTLGTLLYHALLSARGHAGPALGPVVGPTEALGWRPEPLLALAGLLGQVGPDRLQFPPGTLAALAGLTGVLALVGVLESALNLQAQDSRLGSRHDPRHELGVLGWCNVVSGLLGGLPVVMQQARAGAITQAGGRGPVAAMAGTLALVLLFLAGGPLLATLPTAVLGGLMLVVGLGLIDPWTGQLLRRAWRGPTAREARAGLAVVLLVGTLTVGAGFVVGVVAGVLVSMALFIARMNRSLLRSRYRADERPSRRLYPPADEALLAGRRAAITVFELDGALYFGNGERLIDEAEALPPSCRCLVLDLRRVTALDETGADALLRLQRRLHDRETALHLAGLAPGREAARVLAAFAADTPVWPDADRAVEAAERQLLAAAPGADTVVEPVALADAQLMQGLDPAQRARVAARMQPCRLAAGERLFAAGDAADDLYVLATGSVSVLGAPDARGHSTRYVSFSPGMMLGETALLDGGGRTAAAVADEPSQLWRLGRVDLAALGAASPELTAVLMRNIAVHLSQRLRGASGAWRESSG